MGKKIVFRAEVTSEDIAKTQGDLSLALWYSALRTYRRAFGEDGDGYTRVAHSMVEREIHINRTRCWRYCNRLADLGLIDLSRDRKTGFAFRLR